MRKEEIRHDPVREKIIKTIDFLKNNQNKVIISLMIVVLLIGSMSFYKSVNNLKSDNASNIAGLAQNTFINGDFDGASVKFERVMNDYPGTSGALQAIIFLLNNALKNNDYALASDIINKYNGSINNISDPIIKSYIYKVQGDIAFSLNDVDNAVLFYRKASDNSININYKIKYDIDISSMLLVNKQYNKAILKLNDILDIKDIGFNEKNKAEELLAFANSKLGT